MPEACHAPKTDRSRAARLALLLAVIGLALRVSGALNSPFWVDEAESSINALTILQHGYPADEYLGQPLYENTLTEPWPADPEHEFRDSSYAARGMAVYHGWLPLYAIAAAQKVFGVEPDDVQREPKVRHREEWVKRSLVPRVPSLLFSTGFLFLVYRLTRDWAGAPAAVAAVTWAALSERAVFFGIQARYYSLTLLMTALAAWCLWRAVGQGRWRDFLLLGAAEALLFHTHQVSALVFALTALVTLPRLLRQPQGWPKAAGGFAVAALLTIPWALWSGFFITAAAVPKVAGLFASGQEWLRFLVERRDSLFVLALAILGLAAARLHLLQRWPRLQSSLRPLGGGAAVLLAWILIGFLAVHLVMPAASYFPNRLTLTMQVAGIVLVGGVIGAVAQAISVRRAPLLASLLAALLLTCTGKLAAFPGFRLEPETFAPPAAVALASREFPANTRFYATPNDQLVYAYLTGLPVQSVAPIRRSFLENYPGPIVFIQNRHVVTAGLTEIVRQAAETAGVPGSREQIESWADAVWRHHVAQDLINRGLQPPPAAPLPEFLQPALQHLATAEATYIANTRRKMPIFRDVDVETVSDLWMSFSYRFVNYAERLGRDANIQPRLERASIELLPDASAVIFHCPPAARDHAPNARHLTRSRDSDQTGLDS